MNERIIELAEQAGQESFDSEHTALLQVSTEDTMYEVPAGFIEKFAKLIVLECAGVTLDYKNDAYYTGWCDHSAEILTHFGVEE